MVTPVAQQNTLSWILVLFSNQVLLLSLNMIICTCVVSNEMNRINGYKPDCKGGVGARDIGAP